jgi:hypothetical protein
MTYPPPPYADALCGVPVCGEAVCGAWWGYPASAGLRLGGELPLLDILEGDIVPAAGLALGALAPGLSIGATHSPPSAGLAFGASAPALVIASVHFPPAAGLALGASVPERVGAESLLPVYCLDVILQPDSEGSMVLVEDAETTLALSALECE